MKIFVLALIAATAPVLASIYPGWPMPEYCTPVESMSKYEIPPVDAGNRDLELIQTQVIARHGARAPYSKIFCWETAPSPIDATWNCSTSSVWSEDIMDDYRGFGRLYKKQYIAGQNIIAGTCGIGGLLPRGREQHHKLGEILRMAYIGDGPMKLFRSSKLETIPPHHIYLRSDDQERTLGSGQALVDALFPYDGSDDGDTRHMLTWNTADAATDYIKHNNDNAACPALSHIMDQAKQSLAWLANANDPAVLQLERDFAAVVNGTFSWDNCLECLVLARCNDIPLPHGTTRTLFEALQAQVERRKKIILTFQDAWYAKVDMHRMWVDVLARIDAAIAHAATSPKLFVTIGHDSTIMPMLATLLGDSWDGAWTTYAGALVLELYKDGNSGHIVRVLYNGQPLRLPFCNDVLCDWKAFDQALAFARRPRACAVPSPRLRMKSTCLWKPHGLHYLVAALFFCGCVVLTFLMVRELRHRSENPETRSLLR
ncbi:Aste57867_11893 [Aphanomyces stellatus]|uniref:Aste57867_11893 protein n=1 Tax=Aphanomyces stellatus TaxID=120398 RepID=A0A485KU78_9STRA|nr:hypothetical protein As57867_011848 [Aphanomyces stellatus]VFT88748.1 Aste57867_11893 [Aphanomyces stellatus]